MNDERNAIEALRRIAGIKAKESGLDKKVESEAKLQLNQLGIDPTTAARSAALMKIMHDASQGRVSYGSDGFNVEGQVTPEEQRIRLGWRKSF